MPEKRSVSENHGDFEFTVEKDGGKLLSYKKPLNAPDTVGQEVSYNDLPSRSLRDEFQKMNETLTED